MNTSLLCRCDDESIAKKIIEDVNSKLKNITDENHLPYTLSLSCGYACCNSSVKSTTELVDIADHNLYIAKEKTAMAIQTTGYD